MFKIVVFMHVDGFGAVLLTSVMHGEIRWSDRRVNERIGI